ncbi:MAG TPA: succinyl-diaminopimelate desuccinylase [Burkholderiaceae bacterium]|nr:succinyl-diaminopimelate desuccinylase [Burkholderiaceae bacterium]
MSAALDLAKVLIARPSVTPEDGGCQPLIAERLAAAGFAVERFDRNGTHNLWLQRGAGRPLFAFVGHTDVVPPGPRERWSSDPFVPSVRDGWLYGRGSADMKSSIAAFVVAAERFVRTHPAHPGAIALLLTSDEEGPATDGTVAVVEALQARGRQIDWGLVGEPTSTSSLGDTIKNGRRGSLSGRLLVFGVQGHVAYPHLARNPIHQMAPALAELAAADWDHGDRFFPPTTFQVSNLHGGTGAGNVIPGQCEIDFNFRYSPATGPDELRRRVEEVLGRHALSYALTWTLGAEPFLTPAGLLVDMLSQAILEVTGQRPQLSTTGGTSDGRFLARICPQVVEFGPLNASIHQVDERVPIQDLERLSRIYERTLELLLPGEHEAEMATR